MSIWIFGNEFLNICKVSTWIFVNVNLFGGSSHSVSYLQQLDHHERISSRFQTILKCVEVCDWGLEFLPGIPEFGQIVSTVVGLTHINSLVQPSPTWPPMTLCSSTPVPYYVSFKTWWELCQLPGLKPEALHKFGGRGASCLLLILTL